MKKGILTGLLTAITLTTCFAQAINTQKSLVRFKIGNMEINTVEGSFSGMKGKAEFKPQNPSASAFDVCIDANTISTGIHKRDDHLRNEDFFDVGKYPTICFVSEKVSKTADGYLVLGLLTMHGVTKKVQIPFTFSQNTFMGTLTLNRLDYKVGGSGTFLVGNEVHINIVAVID